MEGFPHTLFSGAATIRNSRKRHSSRSFFLIVLALVALASVSILTHHVSGSSHHSQGLRFSKRAEDVLSGLESEAIEVQECRLVHHAKDQCAFILANCEDEEIGLMSYLQLYYCRLPRAKPVGFAILAIWLGLLFSTIGIAASDFLCVNLSTIASILGMSESLTGVTFLAFGNGSPDVFSTFAAMGSNSGSLAIGELIGAAGFITAVVAGSMAMVRPFKVARRSFVRDVLFFTVAASFSLVFVADGELHAWECAAMIAYYCFYVVTVVTWHWYMGRRRRQQERDIAARAHFHIPENQELDINEEPVDDDPITGGEEQRLLLGASTEDFNALERADLPRWKIESEEDDETRDRYLAELQENMRVSRPMAGQRGTAMGPIRPSLVGALEFRSVLASLRKSRSLQSGRIHLRRYSDGLDEDEDESNPAGQTDLRSSRSQFDVRTPVDLQITRPTIHGKPDKTAGERSFDSAKSQANYLCASPTSSGYPSRAPSPSPSQAPTIIRSESPNLLAPPPSTVFHQPSYQQERRQFSPSGISGVSPRTKPQTDGPANPPHESGTVSPVSRFPPYTDDVGSVISRASLRRRSLSLGSEYLHGQIDADRKVPSWWPQKWLPLPHVITSALFPTLSAWRNKSVWDKLLGLAGAPSVLFLTITLPVVEPHAPEPEIIPIPDANRPSSRRGHKPTRGSPDPLPSFAGQLYNEHERASSPDATANGRDPSDTVRGRLAIPTTNRNRQDSELPVVPPPIEPNDTEDLVPKQWNRWLLILQLLTAPFFIALTLWMNLDSSHNPRKLLLPALFSLLNSCIFISALLFATTSTTAQLPKRSRPFIAFLGFAVSIAWISTLATEVVALLKAFGVVLNISDSLLGLTIFAVGNSLGDLVANVTVARLGYPVMALSACFGGPMLNILIGIGVGGLYMTLNSKSQHSSNTLMARTLFSNSQTYHLTISKTLLISGATLLVTLVGLLIVIPMNKWRMDRKIGFGLVAIWVVSTVVNVVIEIVTN
ncbi:hypothetical protein FQN57_004616 [Myotisia sp. PD_48]|nr:hypothetical protein FQN57_004616 [Myotisia sp. PD_48]